MMLPCAFFTVLVICAHISLFLNRSLMITRGDVGILNEGVAPRVSTLLINWCKNPYIPPDLGEVGHDIALHIVIVQVT